MAPGAGRRPEILRDVSERLARAGAGTSPDEVEPILREVLAARGVSGESRRLRSLARAVSDELSGLGPLGPLLRSGDVTEVIVNAPDEIFAEREGRLSREPVAFGSEAEVFHLIERVVAPLGLRVDASSPWVDARLPDGSRFHAVVPPVALRGPAVTIRKFSRVDWTLDDLLARGSLDDPTACALAEAVRERRNVLVSGGAGAGKTTLLGVLARMVSPEERMVTIEDAAELRLGDRHVVALETRPPNVEGRGEVTMRQLVRCALRMRPDRIVVGEVRDGAALDMLQALNSGHAGSMATVHANSAAEALVRLEALALMGAAGLSVEAARRQVEAAIDVVVHMCRRQDGSRVVAEVREAGESPYED